MSNNIQYGNATHQRDLALSDISTLISYPVVSLTSIPSPFFSFTYHSLPEGKYSHAAVWPLTHGYDVLDKDGKTTDRHFPTAAMVANLAKETPETPALIRHFDVVVFFHEMGHVFHHLLSKTKYYRFHGTKYVNFIKLCLLKL